MARISRIASFALDQAMLASTRSRTSGPMASRTRCTASTSVAGSLPTFTLTVRWPSRTRSSAYSAIAFGSPNGTE